MPSSSVTSMSVDEMLRQRLAQEQEKYVSSLAEKLVNMPKERIVTSAEIFRFVAKYGIVAAYRTALNVCTWERWEDYYRE